MGPHPHSPAQRRSYVADFADFSSLLMGPQACVASVSVCTSHFHLRTFMNFWLLASTFLLELLVHPHQMAHLENEATRCGRVHHLDRLADAAQAESAQRLLLRLLEA